MQIAASTPIRDMNAFAGARESGLRAFANRGLNGIDGLVATAAGLSLGAGTATLLCGDLALLHDVGGLMAAGQLNVDLDVVVINNGGGAIFEQLPIADHASEFERLFLTPQTTEIAALVTAAGGQHVRSTDLAVLHNALSERVSGLRVIEHIVDRQDCAAMRAQVWADAADALRTWKRASGASAARRPA